MMYLWALNSKREPILLKMMLLKLTIRTAPKNSTTLKMQRNYPYPVLLRDLDLEATVGVSGCVDSRGHSAFSVQTIRNIR